MSKRDSDREEEIRREKISDPEGKRGEILKQQLRTDDPEEKRRLDKEWLEAGGRELMDEAIRKGLKSLKPELDPVDYERVHINFNFTGPGTYYLWTLDEGSLVTELGDCENDRQVVAAFEVAYTFRDDVRERLDAGERMTASRTGHLT